MRNSSTSARRHAGASVLGSIVLATLALAPVETARADALARHADPVTCPECDPARHCPVPAPGGPYAGLVGVPLEFDGTASSDPDGERLTFAWDFDASDGIGEDALGPTPSHVYPRPGRYTVGLTVSSGDELEFRCVQSSTTTAEIGSVCGATVLHGHDAIRLGSGGADWFASIQPASGCYANTDVILSSFVLRYGEKRIPASAVKTAVGDKDGDGIEEIGVSYSKSDLKALFAGTRHINGHRLVSVTIEANLATGGVLQGTTRVDLYRQVTGARATVSPNPFNPSTTLTFTTERAGRASVALFDVAGRLVRTLLDERALAPGVHEVRVEGRGDRGERLPSGIYFLRGVSADGEFAKTVTLLQ